MGGLAAPVFAVAAPGERKEHSSLFTINDRIKSTTQGNETQKQNQRNKDMDIKKAERNLGIMGLFEGNNCGDDRAGSLPTVKVKLSVKEICTARNNESLTQNCKERLERPMARPRTNR